VRELLDCRLQSLSTTRRRSAQSKTHEIRTWHFFAEFFVRSVLDCSYPLSSAEDGDCFGGFGLGVAQPGSRQVPRSGAGGGGSDFCAVAGRERASLPTRRAKWINILFALGSWRHGQRDLVKTSR
jgi:hypothetical protein